MFNLLKKSNLIRLSSNIIKGEPKNLNFKSSTYTGRRYFRPQDEFKFWEEQMEKFAKEFQQRGGTYRPRTKIDFYSGWAELYYFPRHKLGRFFFLTFIAAFGYVGYSSIKKIINYQDRSILGFIFYFFLSIYTVRACRMGIRQASAIVESIALKEDGRHIGLKTYKYGLFPDLKIVDISTVVKPLSIFDAMAGKFGFTFIAGENVYILPRSGEILNQEILPVVLNGNYIEIEDEIVY